MSRSVHQCAAHIQQGQNEGENQRKSEISEVEGKQDIQNGDENQNDPHDKASLCFLGFVPVCNSIDGRHYFKDGHEENRNEIDKKQNCQSTRSRSILFACKQASHCNANDRTEKSNNSADKQ